MNPATNVAFMHMNERWLQRRFQVIEGSRVVAIQSQCVLTSQKMIVFDGCARVEKHHRF